MDWMEEGRSSGMYPCVLLVLLMLLEKLPLCSVSLLQEPSMTSQLGWGPPLSPWRPHPHPVIMFCSSVDPALDHRDNT